MSWGEGIQTSRTLVSNPLKTSNRKKNQGNISTNVVTENYVFAREGKENKNQV